MRLNNETPFAQTTLQLNNRHNSKYIKALIIDLKMKLEPASKVERGQCKGIPLSYCQYCMNYNVIFCLIKDLFRVRSELRFLGFRRILSETENRAINFVVFLRTSQLFVSLISKSTCEMLLSSSIFF